MTDEMPTEFQSDLPEKLPELEEQPKIKKNEKKIKDRTGKIISIGELQKKSEKKISQSIFLEQSESRDLTESTSLSDDTTISNEFAPESDTLFPDDSTSTSTRTKLSTIPKTDASTKVSTVPT